MNNFGLIYKTINEVSLGKIIKDRPIRINAYSESFNSGTLLYILQRVKYLKRYKWLPLKVDLILGDVSFADKITYLMLDMIIYDIFVTTKFDLKIKVNVDCTRVMHNGFKGTALYRATIKSGGKLNKTAFITEYENSIYIDTSIYRRYYKRDILDTNPQIPSIVATEIESMLSPHYNDDVWIEEVCEAVAELVDNTIAHTDSDCLIDLDICDTSDEEYKVLTIAVINFSEERLFDRIKSNIIQETYPRDDSLYEIVYSAYDNHKQFASKDYTSDDFFHITAYQNGVSTRTLKSGSSGTGLTTLIRNIIGKTDETFSYSLSGNNIVFFHNDYMKVLDSGFIGFNEESDYINYPPSDQVVNKSSVYIPGTVFQLSLVRKNNGK